MRRWVIGLALTLAGPALAGPALAGPPTLGDALHAIGAFGDAPRAAPAAGPPADPAALAEPARFDPSAAVDPRLAPPPPSQTVWPRIVIVTGVALIVAGIAGMVASPGCATRDAADRCLDARGSHPAWPALIVVGLGATVTGNYWDRWTRLDVPSAQDDTP